MQGTTQANRAYIGVQSCCKSKQCFYKGQKRQKMARAEWIETEYVYPVIISVELFEEVQRVRLKGEES